MASLFKYESSLIESDYWSLKLPAENSAELFAQDNLNIKLLPYLLLSQSAI